MRTRPIDERHIELMRRLTAAQAALWDVVDDPDAVGARQMFGVMMASASRLTRELLGDPPIGTGGKH